MTQSQEVLSDVEVLLNSQIVESLKEILKTLDATKKVKIPSCGRKDDYLSLIKNNFSSKEILEVLKVSVVLKKAFRLDPPLFKKRGVTMRVPETQSHEQGDSQESVAQTANQSQRLDASPLSRQGDSEEETIASAAGLSQPFDASPLQLHEEGEIDQAVTPAASQSTDVSTLPDQRFATPQVSTWGKHCPILTTSPANKNES